MLTANMPIGKLHKETVKRVRAAYQSRAVDIVAPMLNDEETAVLKRGRNAATKTVPKSSNPIEYHRATSLEALFGYLYLLGNSQRIVEIFDKIWYNTEV